jgi:hypothetical protein
MTKKQPHVPEMYEVKPNLQQRRHPETAPQDRALVRDTDAPAMNAADVQDPRAKATGHGKKTADKWNQ